MEDNSRNTNRKQMSGLSILLTVVLVGMYGLVLFLFVMSPNLVTLFFLLGCVPGAAIGALCAGRRGVLLGLLTGGALGPIIWILVLMWGWSGNM